jgi:nucleotide-binding universal stress UspA family protein
MFKRILVPTDGSDLSIQAAMRAVSLAKLAGAAITTLFVQDVHPYTPVGDVSVGGLQEYVAAVRAEGVRAMQRVVAIATAEGVSTDTLAVENSQTANGIVDAVEATGADLIVMGSHGRSGLAKLMVGSVAAKVLVLSPVAVLVIK